MGNLCGPLDPETITNTAVEDGLAKHRQAEKLTKNLLLLGTGNSGKSTIFKQLRQIHGPGFGDKDVVDGLTTIYDSVLGQMKTLILKCRHNYKKQQSQEYELSEVENQSATFILDQPRDAIIDQMTAQHIKTLWDSTAIRKTFETRKSLAIVDSCPHFFNDIVRIGAQNYMPTEKDLLLVRSPTAGVTSATFEINNNKFKIFDVGGQKNERRKWIHCFEGVTAVLYVASLSCYDQALFEDETVNGLMDSLNLFEEIVNARWFRRTAIILFLNKSDLFAGKIENIPLTVCFPDYVFDAKDNLSKFDHGTDYIRKQFHARNHSQRHQNIYTHVTCGIDRENVTRVFNDVQHIVINASLARGGLL